MWEILAPRFSRAEVMARTSSDSECSILEPAVKKAKFTGAFKYKTKFSEAWKRTWPFISSVAHDPYRFRCNLCDKSLSCGHQGITDVKDHISTQSHQRLAKSMESQPKLSFSANPLKDKVSYMHKRLDNLMCSY